MKALGFALALFLLSTASAQVRFPLGKPQYSGVALVLAYLSAEGLPVSPQMSHDFFMHRNPTRNAYALMVIKWTPKLKNFLRSEEKYPPKADDDLRALQTRRGIYASGLKDSWELLLRELEPEIKKLGGNVSKLTNHLNSCMPLLKKLEKQFDKAIIERGGTALFADVPFRHWAENEIHELRDAGILTGYPDGKFRG